MVETKEKILSIALYYFLKKPYTEVKMNDILKASGLSKGGFYHHFESKEALYQEVMDHFVLKTFSTEYGHFTENPYNLSFSEFVPFYIKSTLEHLIELADSKLTEFSLKIDEVNLYMVMFDMMKHYKEFDKILANLHNKEIEMFKTVIDKAKESGEIRKEIDSLSLASHVHTLMHGIGVLTMLEENMDNLEEKIKEHFDNMYKFIKT
ncbi:MAG TPA: TetR/AcrR family transcriptional regulator [Bacteroidales bacterium]|jgi:AcrR family transcriptional regulator|nr:TetR/AcrR family transcriptional regulator [Bacteroidales bacterium]